MQDYYGHVQKLGMNRASPFTQWPYNSRHNKEEREQKRLYDTYPNKQEFQQNRMENDPFYHLAEAETIMNEDRWFARCGWSR